MTTYAQSGVNIAEGDKASKHAYAAAMNTFPSRTGMIGSPVKLEGGFAGALDFGNHYLVLGCDGVGTKIDIALETQNFSGLGHDLLAMVVDDAVCIGAEVTAITNTVDTQKVDAAQIAGMMDSLAQACTQQKVVIPGGEIAELGATLSKTIWNATALGIVEKDKYITAQKITPGDAVISLKETGFRSNGFSLVRYILKQNNISYFDDFGNGKTWGQMLLTPSTIYHDAILHLIGRYEQERKIDIHGIAHITGGGLAGNLSRILKHKKLGANLPNLWEMPQIMGRVQELGNVADTEAHNTWNMGNGMLLVLDPKQADSAIALLSEKNIEAKICGHITPENTITHKNLGIHQTTTEITTPVE